MLAKEQNLQLWEIWVVKEVRMGGHSFARSWEREKGLKVHPIT